MKDLHVNERLDCLVRGRPARLWLEDLAEHLPKWDEGLTAQYLLLTDQYDPVSAIKHMYCQAGISFADRLKGG